jgi:hypothetical protein
MRPFYMTAEDPRARSAHVKGSPRAQTVAHWSTVFGIGKRRRPTPLLRLPAAGRLLVCTDLHGNLADFRRIRDVFEASRAAGEDPFLLFTGDLIHGPDCGPADWPEYLGAHYIDQSEALLDEYLALRQAFPERVSCLLGNHEHSHIGGPHTPKFWPDETVHFEEVVGPSRTRRYKEAFRQFPTVAVSSCGVAVTHAAPNVSLDGPEDLEQLEYEGFEDLTIWTMAELQILGGLLWSRSCTPEVARRFLDALGRGGPRLDVVVYGHEIVPEGYAIVGDEQLGLSTSFGVRDECKFYLTLNLAGRYTTAHALREGVELLRLCP